MDRYGVIEPAFNLHPKLKFRSVDFGSRSSSHMPENYDGLKGKFQKFASVSSPMHEKSGYAANCYQSDEEMSINQILNQVCTGNSRNSNLTKLEAIHQLVQISKQKGNSVWFKKDSMEEHLEVLIMKLLHATKDSDMTIVNQAQRCLNVVRSQYEPLRCLAAIIGM